MKLKEGISNVDFQHLESAALTLCDKDAVSSKELGEALIKVRDACEAHGDFTKWMRAHKVDRNRVNYCVRLIEGKVAKAKGRKGERALFLFPEEWAGWLRHHAAEQKCTVDAMVGSYAKIHFQRVMRNMGVTRAEWAAIHDGTWTYEKFHTRQEVPGEGEV